MVRAQVLLLESLKIKKLEAVVGFSMGGQVAYHWGILHPGMYLSNFTSSSSVNLLRLEPTQLLVLLQSEVSVQITLTLPD